MLLPIQRALFPFVNKANNQNPEEHHHRQKTEPADLLQHDGPGKEKCDFEIEQDKKNGDEVIAHIELHARIFKRLEAALVGGKLFCVGIVIAQQNRQPLGRYQRENTDGDANDDENQNGEIIFQVARIKTGDGLLTPGVNGVLSKSKSERIWF